MKNATSNFIARMMLRIKHILNVKKFEFLVTIDNTKTKHCSNDFITNNFKYNNDTIR